MSPLEALASGSDDGGSANRPIIKLTDAALAKLLELRADESDAEELGLRVAIASGPGEDFRYDLSFDEFLKAAFTDEVRTHEGADGRSVKVVVPGSDARAPPRCHPRLHRLAGARDPQPQSSPGARHRRTSTSDDELSAEIETLVTTEVNPALAAHGGFVTYVGHDGGRHRLHDDGRRLPRLFDEQDDDARRRADDALRTDPGRAAAWKDLTDHSTGENPFYS